MGLNSSFCRPFCSSRLLIYYLEMASRTITGIFTFSPWPKAIRLLQLRIINTILFRRSFISLTGEAKFKTESLLSLGEILVLLLQYLPLKLLRLLTPLFTFYFICISAKTKYRMFNIKIQITYSEFTCT